MAELFISPLAKADMEEIGDYISRELCNPEAALNMIRRFRSAIAPLRDLPQMGAPLLAPGKQGTLYRYLVCGSYLIFYHMDGTSVYIDRILYGRRDYLSLLFVNELGEE